MPTLYKIKTQHVPWFLFFDCELGTTMENKSNHFALFFLLHIMPRNKASHPLFCFNPIKRQPFYHILRLKNPFHAIEFATPHVLSSSCLKNTVLTHGIGNKTAVKRRRPSCRRENGHHRKLFSSGYSTACLFVLWLPNQARTPTFFFSSEYFLTSPFSFLTSRIQQSL